MFKKKARSRQYPAKTITNADIEDDIALLANRPAQEKFLLLNLEQAAGDIGIHVNANKAECKCFK